jgi:hypothetical protein
VLNCSGIETHSLQKELPAAQRDWLPANSLLIGCDDKLNDFVDTAALISLLDLVVTIDTSVAQHCAPVPSAKCRRLGGVVSDVARALNTVVARSEATKQSPSN